VNWLYVAVLTALVFFSTLIGALFSFKRAFRTAVLSAHCLRRFDLKFPYSRFFPRRFVLLWLS
jgi:hypothetical protein